MHTEKAPRRAREQRRGRDVHYVLAVNLSESFELRADDLALAPPPPPRR